MPLNIDQSIGLHVQALNLRDERAQVLSANIANADTPNFKARDLDFARVLTATASTAVRPLRTHAAHIALGGGFTGDAELKYRVPLQASLDGNTVDTQFEKTRFAENAIEYQTSLEFLNSRLRGIMGALKGE